LNVPNIGPTELIIVLVIVLLVFGPKRLPGLGRQLGSGMREFKDSITSKGSSDDDDPDDAPEVKADPADANRRQANAALGRPDSEPVAPAQPVDADVVPDRNPR
jgi:sec-independent protein translocase protein TatA